MTVLDSPRHSVIVSAECSHSLIYNNIMKFEVYFYSFISHKNTIFSIYCYIFPLFSTLHIQQPKQKLNNVTLFMLECFFNNRYHRVHSQKFYYDFVTDVLLSKNQYKIHKIMPVIAKRDTLAIKIAIRLSVVRRHFYHV